MCACVLSVRAFVRVAGMWYVCHFTAHAVQVVCVGLYLSRAQALSLSLSLSLVCVSAYVHVRFSLSHTLSLSLSLSHSLQYDWPARSWKVPSRQLVQMVALLPDWNEPAAQSTHALSPHVAE